jgi:hypothetical protein
MIFIFVAKIFFKTNLIYSRQVWDDFAGEALNHLMVDLEQSHLSPMIVYLVSRLIHLKGVLVVFDSNSVELLKNIHPLLLLIGRELVFLRMVGVDASIELF